MEQPDLKLGFGLMRMPEDEDGKVKIDVVKEMVDRFLEAGGTYFDTALMYNGGQSEAVVKEALTSRHPRDQYTIATKLHAGFFDSMEERDQRFQEQLEKTGAEYFDYYLVHGIESSMLDKYEKYDVFNWVLNKKKEGLVRHAGFSFHDTPELLDEILTKYPEMEFVQLQINYLDWDSEWIRARENLEVARKHGKPVIVMEPVKGGTLAALPPEAKAVFDELNEEMSPASYAIRFAAGQPGVMMVLSGMSSLEQMEDNLSYMKEFRPLSKEEEAACFAVADIINNQIAIPCTACEYCIGGCPMNIAIPKYFSLYNEDMRDHLEEKGWTINFTNYDNLAQKHGKAKECIECGQCEGVCPQHLPIIEYLRNVSEHFDHD